MHAALIAIRATLWAQVCEFHELSYVIAVPIITPQLLFRQIPKLSQLLQRADGGGTALYMI